MKRLLIALFFILPFVADAQVDSTQRMVGPFTLRRGDWAVILPDLVGQRRFERLYDSAKVRFAQDTSATETLNMTVAQAKSGQLLALAQMVKRYHNEQTRTVMNRIVAAIRAVGDPWINNQLDAQDAQDAQWLQERKSKAGG